MHEFMLPDLGEGMQEAEIRRWLVQPGDTIKRDQTMVEVETDKAVVEIPSPVAGKVAAIRVPAGSTAKLGEVLVVFDTPDAPSSSPASSSDSEVAVSAMKEEKIVNTSSNGKSAQLSNGTAKRQRVLAAPAVRKRAFELEVDLAQVPTSQPHGRVTMDDLETFVRERKDAPAPTTAEPAHAGVAAPSPALKLPETAVATVEEERQPLVGLRKRIAEHMERSWRIIPHATAFDELDGTELVALRQALKPMAEQRGVRLTYMPLLVKLLLPLLKEFPIFNASLDEERREIIYKRVYHIGIAADSPEGLLVPVLRNADQLSLVQIAQQLEHLIAAAQKRTLALSEVSGSTFTLNNIGSFGGSSGTPIINYPEVAILAVGRLQEKAIVRNGTILARTMMPLALSFDHRVIDGAMAGRLLARFKDLVEHPQQLLLDLV
ncbi:dihydrolipoyllysine-residue acetyltransferase component of pyruvate dehydrogenase complex [Reticulibacter mediterranei]|uniref:Dihydrolipoamide acetyltransferase component of pyruvate dehydrogenase complex n=1 Tax=Reticulibacter mediterranei TaxID=2778369 RepID=A0A8J3N3N5_9CHLR|nr:dihydrolipoamide acetyltransferase family protein [Reticulibacter mediterranei]GHO94553.1 dihydrolipoyllysine-residue acetyltransferase component of pyruvate dehydrogenase complex [Reticulibacter mediterranei]